MLKIDSGLYTSASEVISESLCLLSTYVDLHKAIDVCLQQAREGRIIPGDEAYTRLKKKLMSMKKDNQ